MTEKLTTEQISAMTDAQLSRMIAELQGYKFQYSKIGWGHSEGLQGRHWRVVTSSGSKYLLKTLEECLYEVDVHYAVDANDALDLIDHDVMPDVFFSLTAPGRMWRCRFVEGDDLDIADVYMADAPTPARAICEAWLLRQQEQSR